MSHQLTFADSEFSTKRRQTRKEIFLSRMEQILPWQSASKPAPHLVASLGCHCGDASCSGRAVADAMQFKYLAA